MAAVYLPEVGAEDCEILMVEKDWFDDGLDEMPDDQIYVTFHEYIGEVEELQNVNMGLNDDLWFKERDLKDANTRIEELEEEKNNLEEKVAELADEMASLKDKIDLLENPPF